MSETENKKRKVDEEGDDWYGEMLKREEALQAPASAWLREFVGAYIFDSPSLTMNGKMNWPKFWWPLRVPQSREELPKFLAGVAAMHEARHYGSFELQILLHAINEHGHAYDFRIQIDAALREAGVSAELIAQIRRALMSHAQFVVFTPTTAPCCSECKQPRFKVALRYFSFKTEYK